MHFTGEVDVLAISDKRKIDGTLDNEDICAQYGVNWHDMLAYDCQ